jgi:hypothetical protein
VSLLNAQTFVYSGRNYLKSGRSWPQIREADVSTGRTIQLTSTPRPHFLPWCAPDGNTILFASTGPFLHRFERRTKKEDRFVELSNELSGVVGAIDHSHIVLQEYGGQIEILNMDGGRITHKLEGIHAVLNTDRHLMAWETPSDRISHPEQKSHIMLGPPDDGQTTDLGEGAAPIFLRGGSTLLFVRTGDNEERLDLVYYNIDSKREEHRETKVPYVQQVYDLTVSLDESVVLLSGCCGRYGSAVYWRLDGSEWTLLDDNLGPWSGWHDGLLLYATDGRDLGSLDAMRNVWVGVIRVFDSRTAAIRTVVSGTSMNDAPRWCQAARN